MHRVYLLIGGNLGNREVYLNKTIAEIENRIGSIVCKSDIFESEPWGFEHELNFLNQVLEVNTSLQALCLLEACKEIEQKLDREPTNTGKYLARTVDVDILFYDEIIFRLPPLIVPHRHMHERRFVLEPLAQIASNFYHPLLGQTISELMEKCEDKGRVWRYEKVGASL